MHIFIRLTLCVLTWVIALSSTRQSQAVEIVTFSQQGSNVVADGTGSINTTGLTQAGITYLDPWEDASNPSIVFGPANAGYYVYNAASGPANFGTGYLNMASSSTGQAFGMMYSSHDIVISPGYTSGSSLVGEDIWNNTTLAALGLTIGTYTYTFGSGVNTDSLVIKVQAAPEPASLTLLGLGFAGLGMLRHKRT